MKPRRAKKNAGKPRSCTVSGKQAPEEPEESADPPPPLVRVGRLDSVTKVRRQLAKLYSDMRNGIVSPKAGSSFVYALSVMARMLESEVLESRVRELERAAAGAIGWRQSGRRVGPA